MAGVVFCFLIVGVVAFMFNRSNSSNDDDNHEKALSTPSTRTSEYAALPQFESAQDDTYAVIDRVSQPEVWNRLDDV